MKALDSYSETFMYLVPDSNCQFHFESDFFLCFKSAELRYDFLTQRIDEIKSIKEKGLPCSKQNSIKFDFDVGCRNCL